ncbi:hypothetical protein HDU96_003620 [Phlyctochytrium bullatum]|nr:hypothetical protein HDU96_003620 [Phlyctochytrium bullatum]
MPDDAGRRTRTSSAAAAAASVPSHDDMKQIKRELKDWENLFLEREGRKPSKQDIYDNKDIAKKYKLYAKLKAAFEDDKPGSESGTPRSRSRAVDDDRRERRKERDGGDGEDRRRERDGRDGDGRRKERDGRDGDERRKERDGRDSDERWKERDRNSDDDDAGRSRRRKASKGGESDEDRSRQGSARARGEERLRTGEQRKSSLRNESTAGRAKESRAGKVEGERRERRKSERSSGSEDERDGGRDERREGRRRRSRSRSGSEESSQRRSRDPERERRAAKEERDGKSSKSRKRDDAADERSGSASRSRHHQRHADSRGSLEERTDDSRRTRRSSNESSSAAREEHTAKPGSRRRGVDDASSSRDVSSHSLQTTSESRPDSARKASLALAERLKRSTIASGPIATDEVLQARQQQRLDEERRMKDVLERRNERRTADLDSGILDFSGGNGGLANRAAKGAQGSNEEFREFISARNRMVGGGGGGAAGGNRSLNKAYESYPSEDEDELEDSPPTAAKSNVAHVRPVAIATSEAPKPEPIYVKAKKPEHRGDQDLVLATPNTTQVTAGPAKVNVTPIQVAVRGRRPTKKGRRHRGHGSGSDASSHGSTSDVDLESPSAPQVVRVNAADAEEDESRRGSVPRKDRVGEESRRDLRIDLDDDEERPSVGGKRPAVRKMAFGGSDESLDRSDDDGEEDERRRSSERRESRERNRKDRARAASQGSFDSLRSSSPPPESQTGERSLSASQEPRALKPFNKAQMSPRSRSFRDLRDAVNGEREWHKGSHGEVSISRKEFDGRDDEEEGRSSKVVGRTRWDASEDRNINEDLAGRAS